MAAAPITPQFQDKAPQIMRYLMEHVRPPLSDEDAAAILGSFGVETGGFSLREEAGGGGGYGWAQWTGSRRDDMEEWCEAHDYNPYADSEAEYDRSCCAFFIHEIVETWEKRVLTDGGTINGVFYPALNRCLTLDEKTESFWRLFERPGTPHADWRREMAREALRVYRGGEGEAVMPYQRVAISSGHSTKCQGAVGPSPWGLNEVKEATRVANRVNELLNGAGVVSKVFNDTISDDQSENLGRIVDWHNSQVRDLDVSVHFNAHSVTEGERGVEVLWYTQEDLARKISAAIAKAASLPDRGPKYRDDLTFLKSTDEPAVLIEVCFVDAHGDVNKYNASVEAICAAIASTIAGKQVDAPTTPPPDALPRVDIQVSGDVLIFVNGVQCGTKG